MILRQIKGLHWRVADPQWEDPFDGGFSMVRGQRWNAVDSFPVVYLNANQETAQANALLLVSKSATIGVEFEDLATDELPVLVPCVVPARDVLDVLSGHGCVDVGLPVTYPHDAQGKVISRKTCQPMGLRAFRDGLDGIACRSAALVTGQGEELAWFDRPGQRLTANGVAIPYSE